MTAQNSRRVNPACEKEMIDVGGRADGTGGRARARTLHRRDGAALNLIAFSMSATAADTKMVAKGEAGRRCEVARGRAYRDDIVVYRKHIVSRSTHRSGVY